MDLGGSSNLNLHLPDDRDGHVLRVHRPCVSPARLQAVQSVRTRLAERGIPFLPPVPSRDGQTWISIGDHLAEVERCVVGDNMDHNTLPAGMTMLARVHRELGRIEGDRAAASANYVDASSARVYARRAAAMIRSWATSSSDAAIAEATMRLAHDLWKVEKPSVDSLPRQLVHGDFWDNNVLFRDGGVVGILDWIIRHRSRDGLQLAALGRC